ncbi:MAG: IS200/IS605 family transposase [Ignavibacteriales bacterium]|nr:IS200/IS605 family transposase [Ignavibacteriales bacterium]
MPFVRVWIHLIWSTKNREKIISPELKHKLIEHIKINAREKGLWIDSINCISDHIHLLISLNSEMPISKEVMLIKGESSHWINKNVLNESCSRFQWQDEYIAVSVSESMVDKVRNYIRDQELHHSKKSFGDEYNGMMKKYGVNVLQN